MSKWKIKINGKPVEIEVEKSTAGYYKVKLKGKQYKATIEEADLGGPDIEIPAQLPPTGRAPAVRRTVKRKATAPEPTTPAIPSKIDQEQKTSLRVAPPPPAPVSGNMAITPMPGKIAKILVSEGQKIKRGEPICILESMKMENPIPSPADGKIKKIFVKEGESPPAGTVIAEIG